jgi:hypothetical protein
MSGQRVVSLDGTYDGELVRLECVPDRKGRTTSGPYPRHGDGLYVVVTERRSGTLLDYCGTTNELARYFPAGTLPADG